MDKYDNHGFYVGPMVYFGTYPLPLPLWEQMFGNKADKVEENLNADKNQNYFSLPFPEDQE